MAAFIIFIHLLLRIRTLIAEGDKVSCKIPAIRKMAAPINKNQLEGSNKDEESDILYIILYIFIFININKILIKSKKSNKRGAHMLKANSSFDWQRCPNRQRTQSLGSSSMTGWLGYH